MSASSGASRRTVTVLFCDVVDSTALGEALDPETLRRAQTEYYDAVREVLVRHGGTVEKYIGDAVMAVFGLPTLHEDDALRALHAASELRVAVSPLDHRLSEAHGLRWRIRVGVATGEVFAEDVHEAQSFATGPTVVVAQRLQSGAQPSEVLLDDATYRLTAGAALVEPVDAVPAKGKAEPVAARRLIGVQSGVPGVPRRFETPLVGRREQLARLREAYDRAVAEHRSRLVSVVGPAGIGKSRLVREFLVQMAHEATIRVGRCPPYGDGVTFWPVVEVLPDETLEGTMEEIFRRIRRSLEELARERPLVVCFDDVHWAEPTFLNLVDYLQGLIADAPVLLICMSRAELLERRPQWTAGAIVLSPLSAEEAEALLAELDAPPEARTRIAEAAEGNPLFAEQMAAMAIEEGPSFPVPASIKALLAARLDRLPAPERAIVERAAVIGREFPLRAVAALAPDELRAEATSQVLALVRKDLVEPYPWAFRAEEDGFRFRHGLIREAAYDSVPKELRAELHERYARWFERFSGEDVIVGYHLEQAVRLQRELGVGGEETLVLAQEAGSLLGEGGTRAFRRDDVPAAVTLLERAVELLPRDSPRLSSLLTELGSALIKAGRSADAEQVLETAAEAARHTGDRRGELRAHIELHQLHWFTQPEAAPDAAGFATALIPELETLGDDLGLAKAWRLLSGVHVAACRWTARAEALERALAHARRADDAPQELGSIVGLLAQALYYGPTPAREAGARCQELLTVAEGPSAVRAGVMTHLGGLLAMQKDARAGRDAYEEAIALYEQLGLRFRRAVVALVGADIAMLTDDDESAERELRAGYEALQQMGESGARAALAAVLADLLSRRGSDEEAVKFAAVVEQIAEAGDVFPHVLRRSTLARVLAREGELEGAEPLAQEALELAADTDFPALQAATAVAAAEVAATLGDTRRAQVLLKRARAIHLAKGNLAGAERIPGLVNGCVRYTATT